MSCRFVFWFCFVLLTSAIAAAETFQFTNKEGRQISGEIVALSDDWRQLTIRISGKDYPIDPNVLTLDSQQLVKDWLKEKGITEPGEGVAAAMVAPSVPSVDPENVQLEVEINRRLVKTDKEEYSSYIDLVTKSYEFEIKVKNTGRDPIPNVTISYAAAWDEGVQFDNGTYFTGGSGIYAKQGSKKVDSLVYNREEIIRTDPVGIDMVVYEGDEDYRKDELLGALVRITLEDGSEVNLSQSKEARASDLEWDSVTDRPSNPDRMNGDDDDMDDGMLTLSLSKGESQEGPFDLAGKRVTLQAEVNPDTQRADGVVIALGGSENGLAMYIRDKAMHGCLTVNSERKWISHPLPLGEFSLELVSDGTKLEFSVDGKTESLDDAVAFSKPVIGNIDIGFDSDTPVGDYTGSFPFQGEIKDARVLVR